jgi:hypothetical protein
MFKFQLPVCVTYRSIAEITLLMPSVNDWQTVSHSTSKGEEEKKN